MKIAAITGPRRAGLVDAPDPEATGEFAVVKIMSAPLCKESNAFGQGSVMQSFGHEAVGEVVEVAQPGKVKVGDRVVVMPTIPCGKCPLCLMGEYIHCQHTVDLRQATGYTGGDGTCAQYVLKQDRMLVPIPEGMSYDHAAMACCGLGPTFGAMQRMRVDAFDTVLITGLGPVGLGGVVNAACRAARIIGVDSNAYRADLAKELGAEVVIDPSDTNALHDIMKLTDGTGVDKAVDCSGAARAQRLMVDATGRKGHVSFVGEAGDFTLQVSRDLIRKGLMLHGQWHYNMADTPRIMQVIEGSKDRIDRMITHTFPMSQIQEAFELQLTGQCGKVILHPWE